MKALGPDQTTLWSFKSGARYLGALRQPFIYNWAAPFFDRLGRIMLRIAGISEGLEKRA
jgi:hypothetical protein